MNKVSPACNLVGQEGVLRLNTPPSTEPPRLPSVHPFFSTTCWLSGSCQDRRQARKGRREEMTRELFSYVTFGIWLTMLVVTVLAFRHRQD